MNNDNGYDLIIAVVLAMSTQLRGLVPKAQDIVTPFRLSEE